MLGIQVVRERIGPFKREMIELKKPSLDEAPVAIDFPVKMPRSWLKQ